MSKVFQRNVDVNGKLCRFLLSEDSELIHQKVWLHMASILIKSKISRVVIYLSKNHGIEFIPRNNRVATLLRRCISSEGFVAYRTKNPLFYKLRHRRIRLHCLHNKLKVNSFSLDNSQPCSASTLSLARGDNLKPHARCNRFK